MFVQAQKMLVLHDIEDKKFQELSTLKSTAESSVSQEDFKS